MQDRLADPVTRPRASTDPSSRPPQPPYESPTLGRARTEGGRSGTEPFVLGNDKAADLEYYLKGSRDPAVPAEVRQEFAQKARELQEVLNSSATGKQPFGAGLGGGTPWTIHFDFHNIATGESGQAGVQTNDPDAVSSDPRRRELWKKRIQRTHAYEAGWKVEDTVIEVDEDSVSLAQSDAQAFGMDSGGPVAGSRPIDGDKLDQPMEALRIQAANLAGFGFSTLARRVADLVIQCNRRPDDTAEAHWRTLMVEVQDYESRGWTIKNAAELLKIQVRDRETVLGGVDPRSAILVEYLRRLVIEREDLPKPPKLQARSESFILGQQLQMPQETARKLLNENNAAASTVVPIADRAGQTIVNQEIPNRHAPSSIEPTESEHQFLREACERLRADQSVFSQVQRALTSILEKISAAPGQAKWRKLKSQSSAVKLMWDQQPLSRSVLELIGFQLLEGEQHLRLPFGRVFDQRVDIALRVLSGAASSSPIPPAILTPPKDDEEQQARSPLAASAASAQSTDPSNDEQVQRPSEQAGSGGGSSVGSQAAERVLPENLNFLKLDPQNAELQSLIGEGSFGSVFRGTYVRQGAAEREVVAFKQIKLHGAVITPQVEKALEREVVTMLSVRHENLVRLFGVCDDKNAVDMKGQALGLCLCLELCERGSLKDVMMQTLSADREAMAGQAAAPEDAMSLGMIEASEFFWDRRIRIASGMARGMAELYTPNPNVIEHRDLKSMNVLLTRDWTPKISDFGLAKHRTESKSSHSARGGGTFRWQAPETYDNNFSEKADVYSFAVTMWELLTRETPFDDMLDTAIMMAVAVRQERPSTTMIEAGCPEELRSVMEECWAQDPAARPCFADVVKKLETIEQSLDKQYDIFLSHKQTDSQDLCAHLFDLLQARGYRVFLDRRDANKLHDIPQIVRKSRCLVFVLSPKIFESSWCLLELKTAVDAGLSLVPLILESSTWGEHKKNFPDIDADYIPKTVTADARTFDPVPSLRKLFQIKAIQHSRDYFDAFVQKLVENLPALTKE